MKSILLFLPLAIVIAIPCRLDAEDLPIHFSSAHRNAASPKASGNQRTRVLMSAGGVRRMHDDASAAEDDPIPDGTLLVECDRLNMGRDAQGSKASAECVGDVVIRTSTFLVRADRLVKSGDRIVFTGEGKPVRFSGQPSKDIKLYVAMAAKRVAVDLLATRTTTIEP